MHDDTEPVTTGNMLARISRSHARLEQTLAGVDEETLARRGDDGWAIKDHLIHLAAWERSLLALLDGGDRTAAMGIDPAAGHELDALNEAVYQQHRDASVEESNRLFHEAHEAVLLRLNGMSDEDLMRPYSHYQPNDPPHNPAPIFQWIAGNTFGHYDEHLEYIEALLGRGPEDRPRRP